GVGGGRWAGHVRAADAGSGRSVAELRCRTLTPTPLPGGEGLFALTAPDAEGANPRAATQPLHNPTRRPRHGTSHDHATPPEPARPRHRPARPCPAHHLQ